MTNDIDRIREALQFIDPSDRETWLRMGMAIKSELADTGFDLWEAWSQQAESFNGKDARDVWKSIRAGGGVGIGTLFHEAKVSGWRDDGRYQKPTPEELAERRRIAVERAAKEEAEIARERADTAAKAAAILKAATGAKADHPYLVRKKASPVATLREIDAGAAAGILAYMPKSGGDLLDGRLLVVPVKQGDRLSTLELIDESGRKAALAGRGSKVGGYWATERLPDGDGAGLTLLIGEGVATVLSAAEATRHPAIAALSSGNLPAVAQALRERYTGAALVILADLVKATGAPDPHAIEAARLVGGKLAVPDFGPDRQPQQTDFNDMAVICGLEVVARAVAGASGPARGEPQPGSENPPAGEYTPINEAALSDDHLRLLAALRVIPKDANNGKHSAVRVIAWGLRHNDSDIPEPVGMALAQEWERMTGKLAVQAFKDSDPNYSATQPVTVASIYDLAKKCGWNGEVPWRKPFPLAAKIEPEPYPLDALPLPIRAAVEEVAGFVKAPVPMVASSALAALSLACQAHIDAKRLEKLSGPVGLFILVIADSGERKSTCDSFFIKIITDYEEAQAEAAKPALKNHKAASEAWEAKRQGIKEKIRQLAKDQKSTAGMESALRDLEHDKPEPPRIPRLLYADATPEALAYGLAKQWPSGGVVSAEAGIVFGSHGMGKDSVMRNLGLLNQLWDGKTLTIDRRSTESFSVRGARLTVALQVQEPTLREFFTRSGALARGTGFLARFLVAWPESTQGMRQIDPDAPDGPATWPHLAAFHRRIAAILDQPVPIDDDGALTPALLALAPDAKAAWVEYHNAIESELSSGGELYDVRDVASKSADNAARLAALFQMFEGAGGAIGLAAFEGASRIAAWHLSEARRFFGELALPAELADAARLDSWLIEHCQRERTHLVGKSFAMQYGPLRKREPLDAAIRELAELDRLQVRKDGKRATLAINPALLGVEGAQPCNFANPAKGGGR